MTPHGSASGRFTRAIQQRNLFAAEVALREIGNPSLMLALDYMILLAELQPAKAKAAALRWHGRLELEALTLTLDESRFAHGACGEISTTLLSLSPNVRLLKIGRGKMRAWERPLGVLLLVVDLELR